MASPDPVTHINAMRISRKTQREIWSVRGDYHILTYAEEGFSPLDIHGRSMGIDRAQQVTFCETVNQRFQTGSLFPMAAISAVPRALIRDGQDVDALAFHIGEFFIANIRTIKATKVICDFRAPSVAAFVVQAIEAAAQHPDACIFDEIVILE